MPNFLFGKVHRMDPTLLSGKRGETAQLNIIYWAYIIFYAPPLVLRPQAHSKGGKGDGCYGLIFLSAAGGVIVFPSQKKPPF